VSLLQSFPLERRSTASRRSAAYGVSLDDAFEVRETLSMRKSKRRKVPKTKEKNDIQTTRASALFGKAPTHEVLENLLAGVESRRIGGWQIAELEVQAWKKKLRRSVHGWVASLPTQKRPTSRAPRPRPVRQGWGPAA
jgi:hypothetical protein